MSAQTPHVLDDLQRRLDGRLDAVALEAVDAHLATCAVCRRAADDLARARQVLRGSPAHPLPEGMAAEISRLLDAEQATAHPARRPRWYMAAGLAAAALVVLAVWVWRPATLPSLAADDVARVISGAQALDLKTSDPAALEHLFTKRRLPVRVLDLAMMGWRLEGGQMQTLASRPSALYVYRRADGRRLVCQMFAGTMADLPPPDETRHSGGFTFAVYHEGGRTVVFWQEGDILCVLGSDLPGEEVIALAIAKAMKPA